MSLDHSLNVYLQSAFYNWFPSDTRFLQECKNTLHTDDIHGHFREPAGARRAGSGRQDDEKRVEG